MIKAVLWDIDGTVLNFLVAEAAAIRACFRALSLGECTDGMLKTYSGINVRYWQKLERGEATKQQILVGRFEEFFAMYGLPTGKAQAFNEMYQVRLGDTICFYDHATDVIQALSGKVLQCAVTNGTAVAQKRKLERSGLDKMMDRIFISDQIGYEKPDVRFFDAVFQTIGRYEKKEILIIGDSLTSDIRGGNNAGILTCWFNPDRKERPASQDVRIDAEIHSLSEVPAIIRSFDETQNRKDR